MLLHHHVFILLVDKREFLVHLKVSCKSFLYVLYIFIILHSFILKNIYLSTTLDCGIFKLNSIKIYAILCSVKLNELFKT